MRKRGEAEEKECTKMIRRVEGEDNEERWIQEGAGEEKERRKMEEREEKDGRRK